MTSSMTDVDIIKSEPMDLNDDDKGSDNERKLENGDNGTMDSIGPTIEMPGLERHRGKVVQITNVSPGATIQQLATLFGFLGTVTDIRLYPSEETVPPMQVKVCYVCYENNEQCGVAQHLTNTVFIDKALIVVPINRDEIPEESECQHLIKSINAYATFSSTGYLPHGFPVAEPGCTIPGIPPPPVITHSSDPVEVEEIKRTIFVENVQGDVTSEQLMAFFSGVGEVKYMRICKKDSTKYAFIEFSASESVPTALQYNGVFFGGKCLKVEHAKSPIVKPESERIAAGRNPLRAGRDVVKRPTSANWGMRVINAHVGDASPTTEEKGRRSRSRSRSRRSRSRGRSKSSRSIKARSRSGSRSRRRKSRSKSPRRRSSPVRSKRRSRSRTRSPIRRRRSRSKSRSRSRSWSKRKRSRSRSRSRTRRRRSPSRSRSRSPRRIKKKSKSRSRSPRRKSRKRSLSKSPDRRKSKSDKDKDKGKDKDDKKEKSSKDKTKDKEKSEKDKDKEKGNKEKEKTKEKEKEKEKDATPEKDLKSLLDKVYTYEEEKEKEKERLKDKDVTKDV